MSMPSLIELCSKVDRMLQRIRHERHILPPIIRCRKCGMTGRAAEPRVSVRAVILAAARFDIATPTAAKRLEKEWAKYRVQDGLDLYGQPSPPTRSDADDSNDSVCAHSEAQ